MARKSKRTLPDGSVIEVAFTAEQETERDAEEKAVADAKPARAWAATRNTRNILLAQTDWWAASDLTMSDARKKYRKDLRDLPSTISDPTAAVTWPTNPDD
jgi:hypothetical protein